jgi:hypothetical protein
MMWKDWGFASTIFQQAKRFIELARTGTDQESHIRASIVFSMLAFEAYFNEAVRVYIENNRASIAPAELQKVENGMRSRIGIAEALKKWPAYLTGNPLDTKSEPITTFTMFREYRNALVHAKIADVLPSVGKLAQELETIENAELANETVSKMVKLIASHFGLETPTWV